MPFCPSCGAEVAGAFCARCGSAVSGAAPSGGAAGSPQPVAAPLADNVVCALCYVPLLITGIVFLILEPYNKKANIRFHAFQSIFLGAVLLALEIVLHIFTRIAFGALGIYTFGLFGMLFSVIWLILFLLWLYLVLQVYQGKSMVLPIIGPLAQQQAGK